MDPLTKEEISLLAAFTLDGELTETEMAVAHALRLIAYRDDQIAAVVKTATALYDSGVTAGLLGVQLFNDLGLPLPEKKA